MKLLILGGTTFIGKELVKQALDKNHDVTVISLDPPPFDKTKFKWINVNRNNFLDLKKSLEDLYFDCVIDNIALQTKQVNGLLKALDNRIKRYVLTSTVDTYRHKKLNFADEFLDQKFSNEELNLGSEHHHYSYRKRILENELKLHPSNIEKVIVRPARVMGLDDNVKVKNIPRSLIYPIKIVDNGPILMYHDDTEMFSNLVYYKDVASALLLVAEHPDAANRIFNIAGDTVWTPESIVQKMIDVAGSKSHIVRVSQTDLINIGYLRDATEHLVSVFGFGRGVHRVGLFSNKNLKSLGWTPTPDDEAIKNLFSDLGIIENLRSKSNIAGQRIREIAAGHTYMKKLENNTDYLPGVSNGNLSKISIGTFKGNEDEDTDTLYRASITESLLNGINVVDTAINYRDQRSEKVVGEVIKKLVDDGLLKREDVFVTTKGGYLPKTHKFPLLDLHGSHTIRPYLIKCSLDQSYQNLKLKTIDMFLIHNPEIALNTMDREDFYLTMTDVFAMLEHEVSKGKISSYGIATWEGLLVRPDHKNYIDLSRLIKCAEIAGGENHHFSGIELPINVIRHWAFTRPNQLLNGEYKTVLDLAKANNLKVFTSNSALYGEDTDNIQSRLPFESSLTTTQKNLLFVKSLQGVTSAIVGMRQINNVNSAIEVLNSNCLNSKEIDAIIEICKFKTVI